MPKPSTLPAWNTAGDNRITPPAGIQQAGHAANAAPSSSYENWRTNLTYEWCVWVNDGTSDADATAHIVETDSSGQISCLFLEIDSDTASPDAAMNVTNATGSAAEFSGGGAAPTLVVNGSTSDVAIFADAGLNQPAIRARGNGTGPGISVEAVGSAPGIDALGGNGRPGILASSSDEADAHGIRTTTDADAPVGTYGLYSSSAAAGGTAMYAEAATAGTTAGAGLFASGGSASGSAATAMRAVIVGDGYACELLSPSNPERAPLYVRGVSSDPATLQDGDVWTRSTVGDDEGGMYLRERAQTRGVHASAGGFASFLGESRSTSSTASSAESTKITASFGSYAPKRAGIVRLRAVAEMEKTTATSGVLDIYDSTAGVVVESRTIEFQAGQPRDITIETNYTLPAAGARTFLLRYASAAAASGSVSIREASLRCDGVY